MKKTILFLLITVTLTGISSILKAQIPVISVINSTPTITGIDKDINTDSTLLGESVLILKFC